MAITTPITEDASTALAGTTLQTVANASGTNAVGSDAVGTTVSDALIGILNKGGPLMQQAATAGNQSAASRGLLNSSMGVQAAQGAVLGAATPIAQGDSAAKNQTAQFNAGQQNQTSQFNAQAQNQTSQFNAGQANQVGQSNTQASNQVAQFNAQNQNAQNQFNAGQQNESMFKALDVNSREQLANIEAQYKTQMQTSASADALYSQVMKNISDIQMSDTVSDKSSAINSQLAWLRSGMQMVQNLSGIQGLVTF